MNDELLVPLAAILFVGILAISAMYLSNEAEQKERMFLFEMNWTDVSMNPNTFCRANGYSYGESWTANGTYDNVKCHMNISYDQSSFKTFRIWNTTRTANDSSYVYCNGEPVYTVD